MEKKGCKEMIRVLFFGVLATKTGVRQCEENLPDGASRITVAELLKRLRLRFNDMPPGPYFIAINEEHASLDAEVKDNDEVAIMPPFSGG